MALQALGTYAERAYSPVLNFSVILNNGADKHQFEVKPENAIVLQSYDVENLICI